MKKIIRFCCIFVFILALSALIQAPIALATPTIHTIRTQNIDTTKIYYLVPESFANKALTYDETSSWEYIKLSKSKGTWKHPNGTPIRLIGADGKYKIQMTKSSHSGYDYFTVNEKNSSWRGYLYLNTDRGDEYTFEPQPDGGYYIKFKNAYLGLHDYNHSTWLIIQDAPDEIWQLTPAE